MGRGRDFRGPRRRGFDDDEMFSPRGGDRPDSRSGPPRFAGAMSAPPSPAGPPVDAVVKWFNAEKGFGFAELGDGSGDAFLHIAVLEAAGRRTVMPGAKLRVHTGRGQKGPQITQVLEVDESTAREAPPRSDRPRPGGGAPGRRSVDLSTAVEMIGTVKWFNNEKGFGFVAAEDGGKDIFVHISVLERSGLPGLAEGQRVSMQVVETPKGREAASLMPAS